MQAKTPTSTSISGYHHVAGKLGCAHEYLLPTVAGALDGLTYKTKKAFDLGCGNGSVAHWLSERGFAVTGVDPSDSGIAEAQRAFPHIEIRQGSCYDPLKDLYGTFPVVISLEVIEHVYSPRQFAHCVYDLLEDGGHAIISTPYHGYLKNLSLAVAGKFDDHFTALWDHGHIKFWSPRTITTLLTEAGLTVEKIYRVGRLPPLAKSMVVVAKKARAQ